MEVTQTIKAWLTTHSLMSPEDLTNADRVRLDCLSYTNVDMSGEGYTLVGEARITLELPERRQLIDTKVTAMRAEVKKIRSDAQATANYIESQISNLLALEHSATTAAKHYEDVAHEADHTSRKLGNAWMAFLRKSA